ncbi:exonuclease [Anabaena phage Elbi]|nr:exonuclease [Anabaena phage Elbi]
MIINNIQRYNEALELLNDVSISGNAVFLDTETIGGFDNPVMIELAITDIEKNKLFDNYVHPWYMPDHFELKNGCDWVEVEKAYDFESHYDIIKNVLRDKNIIIYNSSFDTRVFEKVCEFYQLPLPFDKKRVYCLMTLRSHIVGEKLPLGGSHTAFDDVCSMVDLFKDLCKYEPIDIIGDDDLANIIIKYEEISKEIKVLESLKSEYAAHIKKQLLKNVSPGDSTKIEIKHDKKLLKISGRVDIVAKVDDLSLVPEKYFKSTFDRFAAAKDFKDSGEIAPGVTYERSEIIGKITIEE